MSRLVPTLLALLVVLGGAGCGPSTGADIPALANRLERVDAAAVADDPEALASAVAGLLRAVDDAESAGDLNDTDADRIRTAADALLDAAEPDATSGPSEPEESTTPPPPPPGGDDEDEDEKEGRGPDPGRGHGEAEGRDKDHKDEKDH